MTHTTAGYSRRRWGEKGRYGIDPTLLLLFPRNHPCHTRAPLAPPTCILNPAALHCLQCNVSPFSWYQLQLTAAAWDYSLLTTHYSPSSLSRTALQINYIDFFGLQLQIKYCWAVAVLVDVNAFVFYCSAISALPCHCQSKLISVQSSVFAFYTLQCIVTLLRGGWTNISGLSIGLASPGQYYRRSSDHTESLGTYLSI